MSWIIDHPTLLGMMEEFLDQSEGQAGEEDNHTEPREEPAHGETGEEDNNLITELLENEEVTVFGMA